MQNFNTGGIRKVTVRFSNNFFCKCTVTFRTRSRNFWILIQKYIIELKSELRQFSVIQNELKYFLVLITITYIFIHLESLTRRH